MSVLTNHTYHEILSMVDFFMTDRASESDIMLDELGVDDKKCLKCNAHVLLADVALDKVCKYVETIVGVSNLIRRGASHVFNLLKNSVWYLGSASSCKTFFSIT